VSIDQILPLVIAFFLFVLPLIEFLLRKSRQRNGHDSEQAEGQLSPVRYPPMRSPRPPMDARLPVATAPQPSIAVAESTITRDATPAIARTPTARRSARRCTAVADLRDLIGVRHAIVLMTILGPCRATTPHEWPERSGTDINGSEMRGTYAGKT
jgi:hypothetical protein